MCAHTHTHIYSHEFHYESTRRGTTPVHGMYTKTTHKKINTKPAQYTLSNLKHIQQALQNTSIKKKKKIPWLDTKKRT